MPRKTNYVEALLVAGLFFMALGAIGYVLNGTGDPAILAAGGTMISASVAADVRRSVRQEPAPGERKPPTPGAKE